MCSLQVFGKITQHVHSLICQMLTGRLSADRHSRSWLWIQFQDYLILPTFKDCSHPYTVGLNTQARVCCHNSHSLTYRAPGRGAYPPQALQEASGAAEGGHALGSEVCASLVWHTCPCCKQPKEDMSLFPPSGAPLRGTLGSLCDLARWGW